MQNGVSWVERNYPEPRKPLDSRGPLRLALSEELERKGRKLIRLC